MSELPAGARALLAMVKDAHDPVDPGARARVRQQVGLAVGVTAGTLGTRSMRSLFRDGWSLAAGSKLSLLVGLTAALGTSGAYWAAHQPPPQLRRVEMPVLPTPVVSVTSLAPEVTPLPEVESAVPRLEPVVLHVDTRSLAPVAEARPAHTARHKRKASRARPARVSSESLPREMALLRDAERALEDGDLVRGSAYLEAHRKEFPRATLTEERAGLTAWARCLENPARGARPARAYLRRFSHSVLRARLEKSCQLGAESP